MPFVKSEAMTDATASSAWDSESIPAQEVSPLGMFIISSASITATSGISS